MSKLAGFLVVAVATILVGCGGGGAPAPVAAVPTAATVTAVAGPTVTVSAPRPLEASTYLGHFQSQCAPIANGINFETGQALFSQPILTITDAIGASARLTFRFDFFDNAICSGQPVGSLQNSNPDNKITLTAEVTTSNGLTVHKLLIYYFPQNINFYPGPTLDTVIFGSDLRLQLPRQFFSNFVAHDLWHLSGIQLFEGAPGVGADQYPTALHSSPDALKLSALPPAPELPCAGKAVAWTVNSDTCSATPVPSASRLVQLMNNTTPDFTGNAKLTCSNGAWSSASDATCKSNFTYCPAQNFTWSTDPYSCSGSTVRTRETSSWTILENNLPNVSGNLWLMCTTDGTWLPSAVSGCTAPPPPPPVITDPLVLAQARNCLACHSVTGPGLSFPFNAYPFPSFQTIANLYRGTPPAAGVLESRVINGSSGTFGPIPMPANPQASMDDLNILIPWILSQPQ